MAKIACFGKDCKSNRKVLRKHVSDFKTDVLVVGVDAFKAICDEAHVKCIYIPRNSSRAVDLCQRLGKLLTVDKVVALPVRGKMTSVELAMAEEAGFDIKDLN